MIRSLRILAFCAALCSFTLYTAVTTQSKINFDTNGDGHDSDNGFVSYSYSTIPRGPATTKEIIEKEVTNEVPATEVTTQQVPTKSSSLLTMYGEHRVQPALDKLPKWFTDYVSWHQNETANTNENTKYLVVTCLKGQRCGGFSDRLRGLSLHLFIASRVDRVLCIHWEVPFPLEAFLQPPTNGLDWRCPSILQHANQTLKEELLLPSSEYVLLSRRKSPFMFKKSFEGTIHGIQGKKNKFVSIRFADQNYARLSIANQFVHAYSYKDKMPFIGRWTYSHLWEHIFRVMFEPIEPLARNINATMTKLGLVEDQYTTVHVRNRYPTDALTSIFGGRSERNQFDKGNLANSTFDGRYKDYSLKLARNALECGHLFAPNNTLLLLSDEMELVKDLTSDTPSFKLHNKFLEKNGNDNDNNMNMDTNMTQLKILGVGVDRRNTTLPHLASTEMKESYKDYFPLFEDLLIMGGSQCVSYGVGTFGSLGAALAGHRCHNIHRSSTNFRSVSCPNERANLFIMNVTDEMLLFGDKVNESDGRLKAASGIPIETTWWSNETYLVYEM
jgi:hypothetical protein